MSRAVKAPAGAALGFTPTRANPFPLTAAMIARRDKLATAIGYVVRNPCSFNAPGSVVRHDRRSDTVVREDAVAYRPRKLGHVVVGSLDQAASTRFFTEGIGFRVSDYIKDRGAFMRCSRSRLIINSMLMMPPFSAS